MRTTLVVPGLASGGPMVTSAARCDVLPRVLKKFFHARSFVRSFAFDVERRGDESDGCSYIITRYVCMFLHARCGTIARIRQRARLRHRERARETPSRAEPSRVGVRERSFRVRCSVYVSSSFRCRCVERFEFFHEFARFGVDVEIDATGVAFSAD